MPYKNLLAAGLGIFMICTTLELLHLVWDAALASGNWGIAASFTTLILITYVIAIWILWSSR